LLLFCKFGGKSMEKNLILTVKTPVGAKIRVFLAEVDNEVEFFPVSAGEETKFQLTAGRYLVRQELEGFYSAERCVKLEEDTVLSLPVEKRYGYGYEPHEDRMVFCYEKDAWDKMAPDSDPRWDEWEKLIFTTPSFIREKTEGAHRIPTNEELWEFVREQEANNPNMRVYTLFESGIYKLPAPIAVFSKDLPEKECTLEELGALLRNSEKPVVHYQAQIHGNETSGCEAAMGMMKYLATPEGEKILDGIHLYIIPRLNPEGALLYQRAGGQGLDLNRDYYALYGQETKGSLRAFRAFQPCLMIDAHELRTHRLPDTLRYDDILLSGGVAPNGDPELFDNKLALLFGAKEELAKYGLRSFFYLDHISGVEMATATRYFAELGAVTVLIECRGIDMGLGRYRRRIMGQFTAARSILEEVSAHPEKYSAPTKREKAGFLDPFDRDFVVEGAYTNDPETDPVFPIAYHDASSGEVIKTEDKSVILYRKAVRTRPRPKCYVLPLGKPWEKELTDLLDRHFISYERKEGAQTMTLSRFVKEGDKAVLSEEKERVFEQGVLTVPVAQELSRYVSFLFEADCPDSEKSKMTLKFEKHLQGFFFPDGDYDIYR